MSVTPLTTQDRLARAEFQAAQLNDGLEAISGAETREVLLDELTEAVRAAEYVAEELTAALAAAEKEDS